MFILLHVISALSSIALASYLLFRPSKPILRTCYGLTGLTLASGTYLVISTHAQLIQACLTGLIYLAVILPLSLIARHRLATQEESL